MDVIYHYTSAINWEAIQNSGFLFPKSKPFFYCGKGPFSERLKAIYTNKLFIVGMHEIAAKCWENYDLMDKLMWHTSDEVILAVPTDNQEAAFVRDYAHLTSKGRKAFCADIAQDDSLRTKIDKLVASRRRYFESTVPLSKYQGNFYIPEIWLPNRVNLCDLKRIN